MSAASAYKTIGYITLGLSSFALALASQTSRAQAITFTGSSNNLAAFADFQVNGDTLNLRLTNISSNDVLAPSDLLTGIFFNASKYLTLESAALSLGSNVYQNGSVVATQPTDVSVDKFTGGWQYKSDLSNSTLGNVNQGLGTAGFGIFNGNLTGGTGDQQFNYGLLSASSNLTANANKAVQETALIQNSILFTFTGATGLTDSSFSNILFQYGTSLSEARFSGKTVADATAAATSAAVAADKAATDATVKATAETTAKATAEKASKDTVTAKAVADKALADKVTAEAAQTQAKDAANKALTEATDKAGTAKTASDQATAAKNDADKAKSDADAAKAAADKAQKDADDKLKDAEEKAKKNDKNADKAKADAEGAKAAADKAKQDAADKATIATNKATEAANKAKDAADKATAATDAANKAKVASEQATAASNQASAATDVANKATKDLADKQAAEKAAADAAAKASADKVAADAAAKTAKEAADKAAAQKEAAQKAEIAAKQATEKEAAAKAQKEAAEKEAAAKAEREKAEKEAAERAEKEKAEKEQAEKLAKEAAEKEAADKAEKQKAVKPSTTRPLPIISFNLGDIGKTFQFNFDGSVATQNVSGLTSTAWLTLKNFTGSAANFDVALDNTSSNGITSRTSGLGFNVYTDLNSTNKLDLTPTNTTASGLFKNTVLDGSFPNQFGNIDVCFTKGNTCQGGQNGGVNTNDGIKNFSFSLAFNKSVDSFALGNFGVRYQSIQGTNLGTSGTGKGIYYLGSSQQPVPKKAPEPSTSAGLGLFVLGALRLLKKKP